VAARAAASSTSTGSSPLCSRSSTTVWPRGSWRRRTAPSWPPAPILRGSWTHWKAGNRRPHRSGPVDHTVITPW